MHSVFLWKLQLATAFKLFAIHLTPVNLGDPRTQKTALGYHHFAVAIHIQLRVLDGRVILRFQCCELTHHLFNLRRAGTAQCLTNSEQGQRQLTTAGLAAETSWCSVLVTQPPSTAKTCWRGHVTSLQSASAEMLVLSLGSADQARGCALLVGCGRTKLRLQLQLQCWRVEPLRPPSSCSNAPPRRTIWSWWWRPRDTVRERHVPAWATDTLLISTRHIILVPKLEAQYY
jgi:hypothetical protein